MKEELEQLHECVALSASRASSHCETSYASAAAVQTFLRDLCHGGSPERRAMMCREFRELNLRRLFHISHICSKRWLQVWASVEEDWKDALTRSALTNFYCRLLDGNGASAWEELLAVELAHVAKFLPIAFLLEESGSETSLNPEYNSTRAATQNDALLHPDVNEDGNVIGVYAFDCPDWQLPFIDDVIATATKQRYFAIKQFEFRPMPHSDEPIVLIGHMGHSGSTLLSKIIQRRIGRPILCEPRELGRALKPAGVSHLGEYFDALFSSNPRPAGIKFSSIYLNHTLDIQRMLEKRYQRSVRVYLLSRAKGEVVARAVRSNSPSLVDKVWSAFDFPPSRHQYSCLLLAHVEAMAGYIRRAESAPNVTNVCFETMAEDFAFTDIEHSIAAQDHKAISNAPPARDLTEMDLQLAKSISSTICSR